MPRLRNTPPPYKLVIKDAIMYYLFHKMEELYKKDIYKLACENNQLTGYSHHSFAYNGEFYNADATEGPPVRQKLHPDLAPKAKSIQDEFGHALTVEKVMIAGYLSSVFAQSSHPGDYLPFLPPTLQHLMKDAHHTFDWSTRLSPEKIEAFKAKHAHQYELIRQRLALNLIL